MSWENHGFPGLAFETWDHIGRRGRKSVILSKAKDLLFALIPGAPGLAFETWEPPKPAREKTVILSKAKDLLLP